MDISAVKTRDERSVIPPGAVPGYETIAEGHFEVARAVFRGEADAGLCARAAAECFGLDFVPVRKEAFDLAVRRRDRTDARVAAFLRLARTGALRSLAAALGGYDVSMAGEEEE